MTDNNGLKDEHGRPVDTLVAEEFVRGWQHYRACTPTLPGVTTASYDLGRQLTAELQAKELAFSVAQTNERWRASTSECRSTCNIGSDASLVQRRLFCTDKSGLEQIGFATAR